MIQHPLYIVAFLCFLVFISEWLCRKTILKHVSSSLLVILLTAIIANIGLLPSASNASPVYDVVFAYIAPISIFFLLLGVSLKNLKKAGLPMLGMFFIGAMGTMMGVAIALQLIPYTEVFGSSYNAIAGMMTGTYIGGSINFNAIALHYDVVRDGAVYTGVVVADSIITGLWMMATIGLPRLFNRKFPNPSMQFNGGEVLENEAHNDEEKLDPLQLSLLLGLGVFVLYISDFASEWSASLGLAIPSIIILTTIALILAQLPIIQKIKGAKLIGMFMVYIFLAVVGAYCEVTALFDIGQHAISILLFTTAIVLIHALFVIFIGWVAKVDWSLVFIASQANIGGSSTALALAKSLNREDLLLPSILAGTIGNGVGTYFGFLIAGIL